jgi:putative membrane protein
LEQVAGNEIGEMRGGVFTRLFCSRKFTKQATFIKKVRHMNEELHKPKPQLTPEEIQVKAQKKAQKKEKKKTGKEIKTNRTFVAFQRTLLAWVRTSTSLFTFGFAIWKLLEQRVQDPNTHTPILNVVSPKVVGIIMIFSGFLGLLMAAVAFVKISKKFGRTTRLTYLDPAMIQAYVILTLCFLTLVSVLVASLLT